MSSVAVAYPQPSFRSAFVPRTRPRRARALKPWSEVVVDSKALQAISGHPAHIKRPHLAALFAGAIALHVAGAWYIASNAGSSDYTPRKTELNIELVRPPKPVEPPKVEPPKPTPPKQQPKQAQVLPQIQQSESLPSTVGESTEAPIAVAPVASEPAPPAPEPVVTLPVGHAGYLNNPLPEYPPQAIRQGWQGTVQLRVLVLANGTAGTIEIRKSSGRKILDDEAIVTVKKWLFSPAKRGDTPIDYWYTLPVEFLL